ncbi:hypothetical protein HY995_02985 [Candidatus Micrarchaeota archaeon]|nr:hypothetical protein [Candidatus Micrarchaeota archaeon]MBI5177026.1 hypothetical protein [Candidatus Micrarchaeota archaeon]
MENRVSRGQLLPALAEIRDTFARRNIPGLKAVGASLGEKAFLSGDSALVDCAAVAYSLAKFLEKGYIVKSAGWGKFESRARNSIERGIKAAGEGDDAKAGALLSELADDIEGISATLGRFEVSVVAKARVKIAADVYAHGASLDTAAQLTRADRRLLQDYVGSTRMADSFAQSMPVRKRLAAVERIFA